MHLKTIVSAQRDVEFFYSSCIIVLIGVWAVCQGGVILHLLFSQYFHLLGLQIRLYNANKKMPNSWLAFRLGEDRGHSLVAACANIAKPILCVYLDFRELLTTGFAISSQPTPQDTHEPTPDRCYYS